MNRTIKALLIGVTGFALGFIASPQGVQGQAPQPLSSGGLHHLGFAVKDLDKSAKEFTDLFGVDLPQSRTMRDIPWGPAFPGKIMHVKFVQFKALGVTIELLQGLDGESPWGDYIAQHGEGIHHIGVSVQNPAATREMLFGRGGKQTQAFGGNATYIDMNPKWPFTFEVVGQAPAR